MSYPVVLGISCTSTHERATALRFLALSYFAQLIVLQALSKHGTHKSPSG
jgi:hypothetical protein